jgi:hypothetical protein
MITIDGSVATSDDALNQDQNTLLNALAVTRQSRGPSMH